MKIAVVGGGPGGLYFAALAKQLNPAHEITVWERNAPDDTFGFGVVFSDETLGGIENADTEFAAAMAQRFARWTDIDIHYRGQSLTVGGQGFAAMSRKELLALLQARVRSLGVTVHYSTEAPDTDELRATHDLVVAADGAQLAGQGAVRRRVRPGPGPAAQQVHVARHGPRLRGVPVLHQADASGAPCRCTATPTPPAAPRSSWRCTRTCGAGPASTPRSTPSSRPAPATSRRSRGCASCSPTRSTATSCTPTTPSG